ncbi:MAG TPA: hypothetical protein VFA07_15910 [Chthonomonadaceae bacterium]|nr:hypothetical protein [Chthonomonadaceae bacterium]
MSRRSIRFSMAITTLLSLGLPLLGCNPAAPENHTPPPPSAMIDRIKNNPNLSPEQKAAAIQAFESHRAMGMQRGKVMPAGKSH